MDKQLKIIPPKGYEVDKENSTFECIKFKPINPKLPKTWEEFCKTHPLTGKEYWINSVGYIECGAGPGKERCPKTDRNLLPSLEYAKAILALCQLIQLRNCYNDGWEPDWTDSAETKFVICVKANRVIQDVRWNIHSVMFFKTRELMNGFFTNFRDLLEIAKPLL